MSRNTLVLEEKKSRVVFSILKKYHVLRHIKVLISHFLVTSKHIKVFEIVVFWETIVFLDTSKKYFGIKHKLTVWFDLRIL
jgi:hypothetical protein